MSKERPEILDGRPKYDSGSEESDVHTRGETMTYWLPKKDIELVALAFYINEFLDKRCIIQPGPHYSDKDRNGYYIKSGRKLNPKDIAAIKNDSDDWQIEREQELNLRYVDSSTAGARLKRGRAGRRRSRQEVESFSLGTSTSVREREAIERSGTMSYSQSVSPTLSYRPTIQERRSMFEERRPLSIDNAYSADRQDREDLNLGHSKKSILSSISGSASKIRGAELQRTHIEEDDIDYWRTTSAAETPRGDIERPVKRPR